MHFELIGIFLANLVPNLKLVNVLGNSCPGHLPNVIICKDPCNFDQLARKRILQK